VANQDRQGRYGRAEVCLYVSKCRRYGSQCLFCDTREAALVVKREGSIYLVDAPSEIVSDCTWWLNKLIIYDLACCIVEDADPCQRLAVRCLALFSSSVYDTGGGTESTGHLAINRVNRLSVRLGICRGFRSLYPSVWDLEHVCEVGRDRIVVLDHLLYCEEVLGQVLSPRALSCSGIYQPERQAGL
jgi:hypothetical protein